MDREDQEKGRGPGRGAGDGVRAWGPVGSPVFVHPDFIGVKVC